MKINELREKSSAELNEELTNMQREHFNLRMQKATGQLTRFHQIKQVRRNIARVKTLLRSAELASEGGKE